MHTFTNVPLTAAARPDSAAPGGSPARFTAVLSDLHVSDMEAPDPKRPGWRRYKEAGFCDDGRLLAVLDHLRQLSGGAPIELVLNGDIFDFDTVIAIPEPAPFAVSWLERKRGLNSEQEKSVWKMRRILSFHPALVGALRRWLVDGHELVFVIGNHDLDLHWPAVRAVLFAELGGVDSGRLTWCEWFRLSCDDTLVIHGNQFDAYCVCQDPLHPLVDVRGRVRVRSPFGNTAGKLMLNGMGYFNPHVEASFIRSLPDYARFFFRYIFRYQPLLGLSWFWSAIVTLYVSLDEGFRPALRESENLAERIDDVARRARARPAVALALRELSVHPAVFSPIRVARELWLDRAFLLLGLVGAAFYGMLTLQWITGAHTWTAVVLFLAFLPFYVAYARSCRSEVASTEGELKRRVGELARIARVTRVVAGHTHRAAARQVGGTTYYNTGHWSPAFNDVECTEPVGIHAFLWIRPGPGGEREAELRAWRGTGSELLPVIAEPADEPALATLPR